MSSEDTGDAPSDLAGWIIRRMDGGEVWRSTVPRLLDEHAAKAREEERAAVLGWLREMAGTYFAEGLGAANRTLLFLADAIARSEHLGGGE